MGINDVRIVLTQDDIIQPKLKVVKNYLIQAENKSFVSGKKEETVATLIQQTKYHWSFKFMRKGLERIENISKIDYVLSNKRLVREM